MSAAITQSDWEWLGAEYGKSQASLRVHQRVCAEQEAEIQDLRAQLAAAQDQLQKPPDQEGGG